MITLIGTGHVFDLSSALTEIFDEKQPDVICEELDKQRYNAIMMKKSNPKAYEDAKKNLPFIYRMLAKFQESMASEYGVNAGDEMLAAINYAFEKSQLPVILFGSGANGSLCLKIARENDNVRAVVALSPGEYFLPDINIRDTITDLRKPVFVTSSLSEFPYVKEVVSGVPEDYLKAFEPKMGEGGRGTLSLSNDTENHSEYWLALLLFFKDLV